MSVSTRKSSRLLGNLAWLSCFRGSAEEEQGPEEKTVVEPNGCVLLFGPGEFQNGRRWQKRQMFLYSNVLLISNTKFKDHFRIKYSVRLTELWLTRNFKKCSRAHTSLIFGWSNRCFVVSFESAERMKKWYMFLDSHIYQAHVDHLNGSSEVVEDNCDAEEVDEVSACCSKEEPPESSAGSENLNGNEMGQGPTTEKMTEKQEDSAPAFSLREILLWEQIFGESPGVLSWDDYTWTMYNAVARRQKYKSILVAADYRQRDITTAFPEVESFRQYFTLTNLLEDSTWLSVLDFTAFELNSESLLGSGDRASYKVPLYSNYALGHPIFTLNLAVEDTMDYISLVQQRETTARKF